MVVGGYLKALVIALAVPVLNHVFMGLAGFLQLRSWSVTWGEAIRTAAQAPLNYALVQAASVGVVFIVAFPHRRREEGFLESVNVRPLIGGIVALCFIAGACLQLPLAEIGNLVQEVWPISFDELARRHRLINPTTWWGGVSALLALVLVAPVTEELLRDGVARSVRVRLEPHGAAGVFLAFDRADISRVSAGADASWPPPLVRFPASGEQSLAFVAPPRGGLELTIDVQSPDAVEIGVRTWHVEMPPAVQELLNGLPEWTTPEPEAWVRSVERL